MEGTVPAPLSCGAPLSKVMAIYVGEHLFLGSLSHRSTPVFTPAACSSDCRFFVVVFVSKLLSFEVICHTATDSNKQKSPRWFPVLPWLLLSAMWDFHSHRLPVCGCAWQTSDLVCKLVDDNWWTDVSGGPKPAGSCFKWNAPA